MIEPAISIIGSGSDKAVIAVRALLAGNGLAHRWLDNDGDPIGRLLRERTGLGADRPVVVFPDGSQLVAPADFVSRSRVARRASTRARWRVPERAGVVAA
jgi:hypothetical protein